MRPTGVLNWMPSPEEGIPSRSGVRQHVMRSPRAREPLANHELMGSRARRSEDDPAGCAVGAGKLGDDPETDDGTLSEDLRKMTDESIAVPRPREERGGLPAVNLPGAARSAVGAGDEMDRREHRKDPTDVPVPSDDVSDEPTREKKPEARTPMQFDWSTPKGEPLRLKRLPPAVGARPSSAPTARPGQSSSSSSTARPLKDDDGSPRKIPRMSESGNYSQLLSNHCPQIWRPSARI